MTSSKKMTVTTGLKKITGLKIIGIDPGFDRTGVAVIEKNNSKDTLLFSSLIQTNSKDEISKRLFVLSGEIEKILKKYKPDLLVIEQLFMSKNAKTVIGVAGARGVILALAGKSDIPVKEVGPMQVKLAVTGYGKAEKNAVEQMISKIIELPNRKIIDDEIDAIAIAITGSVLFSREFSPK